MSDDAKADKAKSAFLKAKLLLQAKKAAAAEKAAAEAQKNVAIVPAQQQQQPQDAEIECIGGKLASKDLQFLYLAAFQVTFQIPVTPKKILINRQYLVFVFNYGSVCVSMDSSEQQGHPFSNLTPGSYIKGSFLHSDNSRLTYNVVHFSESNLSFEKPKFATNTLRLIIQNKSFFLQDTALSRIRMFFYKEFDGLELLGNCVLKQALISTDHNQIPLPRDGQLLLSKSKNQKLPSTFPNVSTANTSDTEAPVLHIVENTNEEGNDIECIADVRNGVEDEYRRLILPGTLAPERKIIFESSYYYPLSPDVIKIVLTCDVCKKLFNTAAERMIHYLNTKDCKVKLMKSQPNLSYHDIIDSTVEAKVNPIRPTVLTCSTCGVTSNTVFKYCIHRETHRFKATVFTCIFCTELICSPTQYVRHQCYLNFMAQQESFESRQRNDVIETPNTWYKSLTRREQDKILSCLYCEKKFNYINSYVIHLVSELQCYRQFVHAAQAHGTPDLGAILLTNRLQSRNVICHICGWNFINQVSYMLHMEHHQFDNNEWIQCKGCQRLYDTPCIFHRHVCQSHDQNNQDINNSDTSTGICLLCQKFYFIQQESQTNRNQIDQPTIEENFEIQNTETTTSTKPSSSDDSNVLAPSKLHAQHCEEVPENKSNNDSEIILSDSSPIPNEEKVVKFDVSPVQQPASDLITIEENLEITSEISKTNTNDDEKIIGESNYSSIRSHQGLKQQDQSDDWYYCLDCHSHNLLKDKDLEEHGENFQEHFSINPAWYYNKFVLRLKDLKHQRNYMDFLAQKQPAKRPKLDHEH